MEENNKTVKLQYTIHKYSSYSASYKPENIMVDDPSDQVSRWFTDSNTSSQYIMLKLKTPAIVEIVKFGKYKKAHVSDLKKFQIFGGMDENNLSMLLMAGLKKDNVAETFRLRHRTAEGLYLPVQYIKIVPLQSWGPAYNYTIWYIELQGKNQVDLVSGALDTVNLRKEEGAVRILLKHLRRRRYKEAFEALSRESGVQLEGPVQARLWNALVENGDYALAETILEEAMHEGEFDWYMSWQPYKPVWRQLWACSLGVEAALCRGERQDCQPCCDNERAEESAAQTPQNGRSTVQPCEASSQPCEHSVCCAKPGPRGGHQLVIDAATGTLYLFGGWNGTQDLDDLWAFCTKTERWTLLCLHSAEEGGPTPRSCHKMVLDPKSRKLYTLGRYLDNAQRSPANMNSEMYAYDIESKTWSLICEDTAACGGPRLVFDHQMCIDADTQTIYVFGGRVLPANSEEGALPQYSGLYAYYIATGSWQRLLPDRHDLPAPQPRVSHSMLFHPVQRRLYIFAGQRNKEHLLELWWYDVATGASGALCSAGAASPPANGFTQRATLDADTDEMFVLSGLSKEKDKRVHNTLWAFSLSRGTWTCVFRNDAPAPDAPRPRFAHQLVLDPVSKIHYLFGGNPGIQSSPRLRLDDLWSLQLLRPSIESVFQNARAALREACFKELCATGRELTAVDYLRNEVRAALDHKDPAQVERFQKLATVLFSVRACSCGRGATCTCALTAAGVALSPRRTRALHTIRSKRAPQDHTLALNAVLGADDNIPEPTQPFEDIAAPLVDTWDVGEDAEIPPPSPEWALRAARIELYDSICQYFKPSSVPPPQDITELVQL